MRELRVEDALLYLDQVKMEFGDRPHIYNEFLDIMKTFKTQQIDTPGVIRRVSNLFHGNRRLVLGFNTFLPEGYKIEIPADGDGPPVAIFRAPGSTVTHVLNGPSSAPAAKPPPGGAMGQQQQQGGGGPPAAVGRSALPPHALQAPMIGQGPHSRHGGPPPHASLPQQQQQQQQQRPMGTSEAQTGYGKHMPPLQQQSQAPRQQQQQMSRMEPQRAPPRPQQAPSAKTALGQVGPKDGQRMAMAPLQQQQPPQQAPPQAPLEFDHAINYVTTIKKRFATEPETYKKFLEILHTYQKEQRGIKEVLDEVSSLFADHPDLLKEFTYFLPDAVQAQAKAQLDAAAQEAEARNRNKAKQAIMNQAQGMQRQAMAMSAPPRQQYDANQIPIPFGATQGRSPEREASIIRSAHLGVVSFAPVRPPRRNELTPAQAAVKKGRPISIPELPFTPNTAESAFFQRAKEHLNRKELAADKPYASKRHTPYTEFLKCLHLFGAGILNKEELVLLLRGLFMQGHAPKTGMNAGGGNANPQLANDATGLLRDFEEIVIGRGPYANQETSIKNKSKYGGLRARDLDFTGCEQPTPSYRRYPSDYPHILFITNPGQTDLDAHVLHNIKLVCVGSETGSKRMTRSIEEYDGVRKRHNAYEEAMQRIEEERFEVDMAIERNAQAMRRIEPFAEEVQHLREQEEKDGQPIGRLQYQLNRFAMNTIHINAIGRIYGEQGDEVLQHLVRNPLVVLPIVYQRLKQKDAEWRKAKAELMEKWNAAYEANYEGSLDVRCYFYHRELERTFARPLLLEECKRARSYSRHPEKLRDDPATREFLPSFGLRSPDPDALLFQPYVEVECKVDASHKDALHLVMQQLKSKPNLSPFDRERIGRIWAEFVVPWFGYPAYWVTAEVRNSFRGEMNPIVVKFSPGRRVVTIFGEGTIVSFVEATETSAAKYRVKLPFGLGNLSPSAVLHAVQSEDVPYVRRDGVMVKDKATIESRPSPDAPKIDEKYQLLFGNENVYLFLRLYTLLCSLLSDIKEHSETFPVPEDPAKSYYNPAQTHPKVTSERLDYAGVVTTLFKVLSKAVDAKEYEALGRKVSKEKVHEMAALPKLVERCAETLVKIAQEDVLLYLYDYCQFRHVDPVAVRIHCFSIEPNAFYRIQYDAKSGSMCFSYLPKNEELLLTPGPDNVASEPEPEEVNGVETGGDQMMEDEDDPIEEYEEEEPAAKRPKLA